MKKILLATSIFAALLLQTGYSPAGTLRVPEEYKMIQEAVNKAQPRDTVIVNRGTYTENISVTKPVSIRSGKGPDSTIIIAAVKAEPVFKVSKTSGVSIVGFTATGSDVSGISLHNVTGSQIANNKLTGNDSGLLVYSSGKVNITNNTADRNAKYGIYVEGSNGNDIRENSASSNGDKGIFFSKSNLNNLTANSANLNTWNGIVLWSSHNNIIKDNKALRNTYGMALSDSDDNELADNSTWPNFFIILPIVLVYSGIIMYMIQKIIFRLIYRG